MQEREENMKMPGKTRSLHSLTQLHTAPIFSALGQSEEEAGDGKRDAWKSRF